MTERRKLQNWTFLVLFALTVYLFWLVAQPLWVPIFLGMLIFVAALTLWSPSVVTVALLVASYIALEVQIRSEETFLENAHGEAYRAYCARVRRWL